MEELKIAGAGVTTVVVSFFVFWGEFEFSQKRREGGWERRGFSGFWVLTGEACLSCPEGIFGLSF